MTRADTAGIDARGYAQALESRLPRMLELIEATVAIDSPSDTPDGVGAVAGLIAAELAELGFTVEMQDVAGHGPQVTAHRRFGSGPDVLLLGHSDTVWPAGTAAAWPCTRTDDMITGPGVGDMKSNLVMAVAALAQFAGAESSARIGEVTVLIVPDEELGSPASREWIEAAARRADVCLGIEPGRPGGGVVVARGAVGAVRISAEGVSAHTTAVGGSSAISALAPLVHELEGLSDREAGVIVTVGTFTGGTARQVTPDHAEMEVDLRAPSQQSADRLMAAVRSRVDAAGLALSGGFTRPAFEPGAASRRLYDVVVAASASVGLPVHEVRERGGSDASFAGALGIPTLDGLGPITHDSCSRDERVEIQSLVSRGAVLARLLQAIAEEGGQ
jgi:glutamate carboxypeptidase